MMAGYQTLHNRPLEHVQHLAADTEGPKPQEDQAALSLLVDSFRVVLLKSRSAASNLLFISPKDRADIL